MAIKNLSAPYFSKQITDHLSIGGKIISFEEKTQQINELIDQNQKEKAVKLIFETIKNCANAKQFDRADTLRERLIKVDSMALSEIIKSAEIIEAEKSKAIDLNHKKIWTALYDDLTPEEANALYFSLKKVKILPGSKVIQQGKLNNKLFFIDQGTLKIVWIKDDRELFLKNITPGEISGNHTFFSISVATASAICVESCTLHYLERERYNSLVKKIAGFDTKLETFCRKIIKDDIEDILKKKEIERRSDHRYNASGKVAVYMLDANKKPVETPLYGVLEGLSEGGLSLGIKSPNKTAARTYLGKIVSLKAVSKKTGLSLAKKGIVLCVYDQLFNNYSISLKFLTPVSSSKVQEFIGEN